MGNLLKISGGNITLEEFNLAVAQTPPVYFANLVEKLVSTTDALDGLYNSFYQH